MVESSATYQVKDIRPMKKTSGLTPDQSLEILQQAMLNCQAAGVPVSLSPFFHGGKTDAIIVLANVSVIDGKLVAK